MKGVQRPARWSRAALLALVSSCAAIVVGAPLVGWPHVTRLPAVLIPCLAGIALLRNRAAPGVQIEEWAQWEPSRRLIVWAAILTGLLLFWLIWTRFRSGEINAVDFTVYFDRPAFQTAHGHPLFVESADVPNFAHRTELAMHAFWLLIPLTAPYLLAATPVWLLALSVIAVVAGGAYTFRILRHMGCGGLLAGAGGLAFVLNDNTARTLNYGFHPEVLYAWFIPWMIDAAIRRARMQFVIASIACVLVKEDACFVTFAVAVLLSLNRLVGKNRKDRWLYLVAPTALALVNLGIYYEFVVPALNASGPFYASYWTNFGATPAQALLGMLTHPGRVVAATLASGFFHRVIEPYLFLPLVAWRWELGILPIVALYGASANPQLRDFGIYYSIILVPFLTIGAALGAQAVATQIIRNRARASVLASAAILLGALVVGSTTAGYSLRPWRPEISAVPQAVQALANEPRLYVQSGLYPRAGYDARVQLLTPQVLRSPEAVGAAALLAPSVSAYPFRPAEVAMLRGLQPIRSFPSGLIAVRIPPAPPH